MVTPVNYFSLSSITAQYREKVSENKVLQATYLDGIYTVVHIHKLYSIGRFANGNHYVMHCRVKAIVHTSFSALLCNFVFRITSCHITILCLTIAILEWIVVVRRVHYCICMRGCACVFVKYYSYLFLCAGNYFHLTHKIVENM